MLPKDQKWDGSRSNGYLRYPFNLDQSSSIRENATKRPKVGWLKIEWIFVCTINSVTRAASKKTRGHMRDQIRMQRHTHTRTHTGRRTESTAAPNNARGHATKSCCPNRRMPTRREKLNKGQRTRPCSGLRRLLYVGACLPCIPVGSCRSAASTPMARNCDCNSTPSISPAKNLSRIARNPTGQASGCNSRTSGSV